MANISQLKTGIKKLNLKEKMVKPIQLISIVNDQLELHEEALDFLGKINNFIGVCICVGPYRSGKSFLLNRIIGSSNVFKIGHNDEGCTEGIWIYPEVIQVTNSDGETFSMIVMDTEGLESEKNNSELDSKIFIISILLSSMFLYNTTNALKADALTKLQMVLKLAEQVKYSNRVATAFTNTKLKENFPDFFWIVRDFALKNKMEPIDMLYKFLECEVFEENENFDEKTNIKIKEKIEFRNAIKENLVNSFNTLDCYYVPVPVSDGTCGLSYEDALQSLETLKYENLREPFKVAMNSLVSKIKNKCQIKRVGKQLMNGPLLIRFIKQIVESLNEKKLVFLQDTVHLALQQISNDTLEEVSDMYQTKMEDLLCTEEPIKSYLFIMIEKDITNSCLYKLREKLGVYRETIKIKDIEEKFLLKKENLKEKFSLENRKLIEKLNLTIANKIWEEKISFTETIELFEVKKIYKKVESSGEKIDFTSRDNFDQEIQNIKFAVRMKLFECDDFESFWDEFKKQINFDEIEKNVEKHLEKLKEIEDKRAQEAEAQEAEAQEAKRLSYMKTPDRPALLPSYCLYEPLTPISPRDFAHEFSPVSSGSHVSSFKSPETTIHLRKDGHADMRYKENRTHLVSEAGVHLRKDGQPDMRFKENRTHLVSNLSIPLTKSGRPDMRFSINKKLFS